MHRSRLCANRRDIRGLSAVRAFQSIAIRRQLAELSQTKRNLADRAMSPSGPPAVHIPIVEEFADWLAKKMDSRQVGRQGDQRHRQSPLHRWDARIGDSSESGAVDPYLRVFGQPSLHVIGGGGMPANPGVNPSLTIAALAERACRLGRTRERRTRGRRWASVMTDDGAPPHACLRALGAS